MDIQLLAAWGEFLGGLAGIVAALGVVGSLIFVGMQLREQNREARLAAAHAVSKEYRNVTETILEDPSLTGGFLKVVRDGFDGLEEVEAMRVQLLLQSVMRFWEDAFYRHRAGRLEDRFLQSVERGLATTVSSPGFDQYWASRSSWYTESFVAYVETQRTGPAYVTVQDDVHAAT